MLRYSRRDMLLKQNRSCVPHTILNLFYTNQYESGSCRVRDLMDTVVKGVKKFANRRYLQLLVIAFCLVTVFYTAFPSRHMEFVYKAEPAKLTNTLIHKHEYDVLLNNKSICESEIFIMFLVFTAPQNADIRETIRQTWGSVKTYRGAELRLVFLIGQRKVAESRGDHSQMSVEGESRKYQDIVQGNFIDSYPNLTYKTVFGLYWVNKYCRKSRFVFKVDDDTIVNVFKVVDFLHDLESGKEHLNKFVYCMTKRIGTPDRYKSSPRFVPYSEYSHFWWPTYCHGTGYLLSIDVALSVYEVTKYVPFLITEDVFVGFCMEYLGIQIMDNRIGYFIDPHGRPYKPIELCIVKQTGRNKELMLIYWGRIISLTTTQILQSKIFVFLATGIVFVIIILSADILFRKIKSRYYTCIFIRRM